MRYYRFLGFILVLTLTGCGASESQEVIGASDLSVSYTHVLQDMELPLFGELDKSDETYVAVIGLPFFTDDAFVLSTDVAAQTTDSTEENESTAGGTMDLSDSSQEDEAGVDLVYETKSAEIEAENPEVECSEGFKYSDGDKWIMVDLLEEFGIHFQFRTDATWNAGGDPYTKWLSGSKDKLWFGPIGSINGCSPPQHYVMEVVPARSADQLVSELENANWENFRPYQETINGLDMVIYEDLGFCKRPAVQVMGITHNYNFYPICGDDDTLGSLLEIMETVQL